MKRKRISDVGDGDQSEEIDVISSATEEEFTNNDVDLISMDTATRPTEVAPESRPSSSSSDTKDGRLCDRCASINFKRLFTVPKRKMYEPLEILGYLGVEHEQSSCELCRLFHHVKSDCITHAGESPYALFCVRYRYETRRAIYVGCLRCKEPHWNSRMLIGLDEINEAEFDKSCQPAVVIKIKPNIDFDVVRDWIRRCEKDHVQPESCVGWIRKKMFPQNLKLIDCDKRSVVTAEPQSRYCALSYVWGSSGGTSPQHVCMSKQPLPALPQTVEDAITVTKELGFKYLWVDRYCIDQSNNLEKHIQIRQMHLIYQNSHVTFIAAAGSNPSHGLPGVSSTPRDRQLTAQSRGLQLIGFCGKSSNVVTESTWSTRAWTFQEGFFSARRIVFGSNYVYFECRQASGSDLFPNSWSFNQYYKFFQDTVQKTKRPWDVSTLLAPYSKRKLSFQEDAIKAFEGAIFDFANGKDSTTHYWGVIIMPSLIAGNQRGVQRSDRNKSERLLAGLCWRSAGEGERRMNFPSWSWAGWICEIDIHHPELAYGLSLDESESPKIWVEGLDGRLDKFENLSTDDQQQPEAAGKILRLDAWAVPLRLWDTSVLVDRLKLLLDQVDQVFALFENEEYIMRVAVQLVCRPISLHHTDQTPQGEFTASNIYGILMSQERIGPSAKNDFGLFFLIVEELGQSFRRIGHMQVSKDARIIEKLNGTEKRKDVRWTDVPLERRRRLLLRDKKRMNIRLE